MTAQGVEADSAVAVGTALSAGISISGRPGMELLLGLWQQEPSKQVLDRLRAAQGGLLGPAAQHALSDALLRTPLLTALRPRALYVGRLMKAVVEAAEGGEVADELAELHAESLMVPQTGPSAAWSLKTWYYSAAPSDAELAALEAAHAATASEALAREPLVLPNLGVVPAAAAGAAAAATTVARAAAARESGAAAGLVTLAVSDNMLDGNTGCHEWEAGFLLSEFILNNRELFAGKACLDVGCGAGLAGLALHRAGASPAVLADGDAGAVANCARNMRINGVEDTAVAGSIWAAADTAAGGARVVCCELRWEDVAPEESEEEEEEGAGRGSGREGRSSGSGGGKGGRPGARLPAFDAVVASDVLYDPACVPTFVRLLVRLLRAARPGGAAYIATTLRNPATMQLFEERAAAAGLVLERVDDGRVNGSSSGGRVAFQQTHALRDRSAIVLHHITLG